MTPFIFSKREHMARTEDEIQELSSDELAQVAGGEDYPGQPQDGDIFTTPGGSTGTWYTVRNIDGEETGRGIRTDD